MRQLGGGTAQINTSLPRWMFKAIRSIPKLCFPWKSRFLICERFNQKVNQTKVQCENKLFNLIGESSVHLLGRLHQKAADQGVHRVVLVQFERFRLVMVKQQRLRLPAESRESPNRHGNITPAVAAGNYSLVILDDALDQTVPDAEGGRREFVRHRRVDIGVVEIGGRCGAGRQRSQLESGHVRFPCNVHNTSETVMT